MNESEPRWWVFENSRGFICRGFVSVAEIREHFNADINQNGLVYVFAVKAKKR